MHVCIYVFVTSDKAEVNEHDFRFILQPEILKKARLKRMDIPGLLPKYRLDIE